MVRRVLKFLFGGHPPRKTHQSAMGCRLDDNASGGVRVYLDGDYRMETWQIRDGIRRQLPDGWVPSPEPVEVNITLVYPQRKTDNLPADAFIPHTEVPDADNSLKNILDSATKAGLWQDDSAVFDLRVRKFRGLVPRWSFEAAFGGYGFPGGVKMALDELKAAIRERRRAARKEARAREREGAGKQGEIEF